MSHEEVSAELAVAESDLRTLTYQEVEDHSGEERPCITHKGKSKHGTRDDKKGLGTVSFELNEDF